MSSVATNSLRVPLLSAQTADETTSDPVDCTPYGAVSVYVIGTGTTSSGVVTIEEADMNPAHLAADPYTGTWSEIATVNASDVSGSKQKAVHLPRGAYAFVRTRISTVIGGGGSISTVLRAV
jgi:hypothetical protein